jgi:hypothetical protein
MNSIIGLSPATLRKAADLQEQIMSLQTELDQMLRGSGSGVAPPGKRKMSAAGRRAIAAGARARWAKLRKGSTSLSTRTRNSRRTMSPATKAKIAAAARERWKKAKAAGKSTL